jgi:hypothetical protein
MNRLPDIGLNPVKQLKREDFQLTGTIFTSDRRPGFRIDQLKLQLPFGSGYFDEQIGTGFNRKFDFSQRTKFSKINLPV